MLAFLSLLAFAGVPVGDTGVVRGHAVDPSGAGIPRAMVRLQLPESRVTAARGVTDEQGRFEFRDVAAGRYVVRIYSAGFLEAARSTEWREGGPVVDLGATVLQINCHGPDGSTCCSLVRSPPSRIRKPRLETLALALPAGINADAGNVDGEPHVRVEAGAAGEVYLRPTNGARLALISGSGCPPKLAAEPFRIDGLGPGTGVCVRTPSGLQARLYARDTIEPGSGSVNLQWQLLPEDNPRR